MPPGEQNRPLRADRTEPRRGRSRGPGPIAAVGRTDKGADGHRAPASQASRPSAGPHRRRRHRRPPVSRGHRGQIRPLRYGSGHPRGGSGCPRPETATVAMEEGGAAMRDARGEGESLGGEEKSGGGGASPPPSLRPAETQAAARRGGGVGWGGGGRGRGPPVSP
jgi:hypothetical protein